MTKNNKLKQKRVVNDDMLQIKKLAFLLIFVVIVCLGIYFLTEKMATVSPNLSYSHYVVLIIIAYHIFVWYNVNVLI